MDLLKIIELNIFAFLILLLIYIRENKFKGQATVNKIFMYIVYATLILLVVDSLTRVFNKGPNDFSRVMNWFFNFLLYALAPLPALLWLCYTDYQMFSDYYRIKKLKYFLWPLFLLNLLISFMSLNLGWFFYVDAANVYHRGPYFFIHPALSYSVLIYTTFLIVSKRKQIRKKHYISLLLFPLPIIIGSILQMFFYGLALNWASAALAILIIYFNIQDFSLNTDYLTGASNRRLLDIYLKEKIERSRGNKSFSAIFIDLDKLKQINDSLGHHVGDEALQDMVKILHFCLRSDDLVARLGGDEFCIIMDIDDKDKLLEVVERIKQSASDFNSRNKKPYEVNFSMGYDIYDYSSGMNAEDFMKHLDKLMYYQKNQRCA